MKNRIVVILMIILSLGLTIIPSVTYAAVTYTNNENVNKSIGTKKQLSDSLPLNYNNGFKLRTYKGPAFMGEGKSTSNSDEKKIYNVFLKKGLINKKGQLASDVYDKIAKNQQKTNVSKDPAKFNAGIGVVQKKAVEPYLVTRYDNDDVENPWKGGSLDFSWSDTVDTDLGLGDLLNPIGLIKKITTGLGFKARIVLPDNITYSHVLRAMDNPELTVAGQKYPMTTANFEPVPGDDHAMFFTIKKIASDPDWVEGFASWLVDILVSSGRVGNYDINFHTTIDISKLNAEGMDDDTSPGKHLTKGMFAPHADNQLKFGVSFYDKNNIDNNWDLTNNETTWNYAGTSEPTWSTYIQGIDPTTGKALEYDPKKDSYIFDGEIAGSIANENTTKYAQVWNYFSKDPVTDATVSGSPKTVLEVGSTEGKSNMTSVGTTKITHIAPQNVFFSQYVNKSGISLTYDNAANKTYYRPGEPWHLNTIMNTGITKIFMTYIALPIVRKQMDDDTADSSNYDKDGINYNSFDSDVNSTRDNPWEFLVAKNQKDNTDWVNPWVNTFSINGEGAYSFFIDGDLDDLGVVPNKDFALALGNDINYGNGYKGDKAGTYFTGIMAANTQSSDMYQHSAPQFFKVVVRDDIPEISAIETVEDLSTKAIEKDGHLAANPGETLKSTTTFKQTNPANGTSRIVKPVIKTQAPANAVIKNETTKLKVHDEKNNKDFDVDIPQSAWNGNNLNFDLTSFAKEHGNSQIAAGAMEGEYTYTLTYEYFFNDTEASKTKFYNSAYMQGYLGDKSNGYTDGPHTFASSNIGEIDLGAKAVELPPEILSLSDSSLSMKDNETKNVIVNWDDYDSDTVQFYTSVNGAPAEKLLGNQTNIKGDVQTLNWSIKGSSLIVGDNTIDIYAVDAEGHKSNVGKVKVNVTKSDIAPDLTIDNSATIDKPLEIPVTDDYDLSGTWSDKDSDTVTLSYILNKDEPVVFGSNLANSTLGTDNKYDVKIDAAKLIKGGVNTLTVIAQDSEGESTTKTTYIKPVYQAPEVTVDKSEYTVRSSDTSIDLSGTFKDNDSSKVRLYYQIAGEEEKPLTDWETNSPMATSHNWKAAIDTSAVKGNTFVTIYAMDDQLKSKLVTVQLKYVKNSPPKVIDANSDLGTPYYTVKEGTHFNFQGHFSDTDSDSVDIYISNPSYDEKIKLGTVKNTSPGKTTAFNFDVDADKLKQDLKVSDWKSTLMVNVSAVDSDGGKSDIPVTAILQFQAGEPEFVDFEDMDFGTLIAGQKVSASDFRGTVSAPDDTFVVTAQQEAPFTNAKHEMNQYITYGSKSLDTATPVDFGDPSGNIYQVVNKFDLQVPRDAYSDNSYTTTIDWTLVSGPKA